MKTVARLWETMKKWKSGREHRKYPRLDFAAPLAVKEDQTGKTHKAVLRNFTLLGICFEADKAFEPGCRLHVLFDKSLLFNRPVPLAAEVRWCRTVMKPGAVRRYGVGVTYR
jgi:hypothetical protein